MGRSKFPGKPSKHCHRKRVNVLPPTGDLVHETNSSLVTVIGSCKENKQDDDVSENEGESISQTEKSKPFRDQMPRKLNTAIRKNARQRNFMPKIRNKAALKNSRATRNYLSRGLVRKGKDTTNFAGKFVLPTRSVHSSRVIKPNKRFIDMNESINVKKKVLAKRQLKVSKDHESDSEAKDKMAFSNGHRVILRQARLKLPNQTGTQGPFSTKLHNGPGTIICGVCGAMRYYRFVKQARKFNIYSCESCRKFISKQIKRQNIGTKSSTNLPCLTGQGTCYVPPIVRSQHWKIAKCAYRSRCPACWLKMCLRAYQLPLTLKQNLTQLLPKNMRGIDFLFSTTLPPILWQKNMENSKETVESNTKQRPVRFKPPQKSQVSTVTVSSEIKRQKIDLKGPRVKHVCRSASVVLGQPLATFETDNSEKKVSNNNDSQDTVSEKSSFSDSSKVTDLCKIDSPSCTDEEITSNSGSCKNFSERTVLPRKERTKSSPITVMREARVIPPPPPPPLPEEPEIIRGILLDYSQDTNYENRFNNGFSIMTSRETFTSAICFLCGSAGVESMLVCSICCEPYHPFCVENFGVRIKSDHDWICMRCAPCQKCKGFERSKTSCPKCLGIYHNECFNSIEDAGYPKVICKECTKCQDCGTATAYNLSSFPGNVPLCLNCIDKKKVGMSCPICQHSFDESGINSKMLECFKCKKWIHSQCEKLTSEQYDILKLLPVSTSFICSQCLGDSQVSWRKSVQNEMQYRFNQVLRLLVKNKLARNILKKGSVKRGFRKHLLTNNLDIDNNNYNKDIERMYSFDECEKVQNDSSVSVNTLLDIKNRLCEYNSIKKFNNDVKDALKLLNSDQIFIIYKSIFQRIFPWFSEVHELAEDIPQLPYSNMTSKYKEALQTMPILPGKDKDNRYCELCQNTGDRLKIQESRLLYCGNNIWVHANCAYWSTDVYEEVDSHLQQVLETIERSRTTWCSSCDKPGASLQCHICRTDSYHFMCAKKIDFRFVSVNKACFCSKHPVEKPEYVLRVDEDFELNKSIFIEHQSLSEGSRFDPEKVMCLIGSLSITHLGKIEPVVSDTSDALIPTNFVCSRVFWSTVEPWRLVTYVITTSIQNPNCSTVTVDRNFTVDHKLEKLALEKAIKEMSDWQRAYEKRSEDPESEDEEEKNGAELLSPELTDTILKDLPHDILDGISVQDIFPNLSYEDMLSLDNSNTSESVAESIRKPEEEESSVETPDFKSSGKEFTRLKSDSNIKARVPPLSLTLSCKLDSNVSPVTKKRKVVKEPPSNILLLQVDGAFDDDSSSECGSPLESNSIDPWMISEEPVTCEKCQCTYRTQASYKRHLDSCEVLCTSESDSENFPEQDGTAQCEEEGVMVSIADIAEPVEVTVQVSEAAQPVLIQAFESYQSQVHTSVVNVVPEPTPPATQSQPQSVTVPPTISIAEQPNTAATISIPVPICVGPSLTQQVVQPSIEFQQVQQTQPQTMTLQPVQPVLVQRPQTARREPVVLQQIQPAPTPGFVPFVDAFGQGQTNQSLQYVQIAPQVQPQHQLLQIRSDGNVIGILPSIQPTTVIVQQPQQLVLDNTGTFGWTQQTQPQIYYGFETIVQNTVMQSQQFLPTPVPGVLAANSSYSTTTQVFQTSKLEPVLDVSSNSFVLVNSGQLEIPQQYSQNQPATMVASQTPTLIYSPAQPSNTPKPIAAAPQNCITLPTTPFITDQNIPMNIVPPIPKPPTSHSRPMSRVLPMPTNTIKTPKKIADATKLFPEIEKPAQIKLDDTKFLFSKDLVKNFDSPKSKNRKFEILDYTTIKSRHIVPSVEPQKVYRMEEKSIKEFEPVEKIQKLSTYEPLKEIEKVKMDMFEEPIKTLKILENEKYLKMDTLKALDSLENHLKAFESTHLQNKTNKIEPKIKSENVVLNGHMKSNFEKLESSIQKHQIDKQSLIAQMSCNLNQISSKAKILNTQNNSNLQHQQTKATVLNGGLQLQNIKFDTKSIKSKSEVKTAIPPKPIIEKALDMPKLEDFTPQIEHNPITEKVPTDEKLSSINVKTETRDHSDSNINMNISKVPPLVIPAKSPKPQMQPKQDKTLKEIEKPAPVMTNGTPTSKPPKKEQDTYVAPSILYTMENKEGFKYSSTSLTDCWSKVLEAVQNARAAHNMPPLPTDGKQLKAIQLTGVKSSHVKYLVEQLPGASKCVKYKPLFNFTPHPYDVLEAKSHGFGAVRCQPHKNRNTDPYDMFSWLSSKHRKPFMNLDSQAVQSRRINNFPMAMKFRNLKITSKLSVGVYRSKIHGKGLFCLRDIEAGEMVIEYAGEVIRSILTDKREKYYNSKGIGCYMFRVDDNFVVDATMKGNAARFINHSCDPNCYSKVVEIMGHKHIIIFALRRILSGEELTYDYKFPFEEDKIPCTCGARRCRKFLN